MISSGAIAGISLVVLFELALPVVLYMALRQRAALHIRNALAGAGVFVLFAVLLEGPANAWVLFSRPESLWFKAHPLAVAVYLACAAALFEETGRLLGVRFLVRRDPGAATPLAYGLGHGGTECILVGVNTAAILIIGLLLQSRHGVDLKLPPAAVAQIQTQLAAAHFFSSLLGGLERACALVLQIALSFLVWRAVNGRPLLWFAAFALHFVMDLPAALLQVKVVAFPIIWLEVGLAALALLVLIVLIRTQHLASGSRGRGPQTAAAVPGQTSIPSQTPVGQVARRSELG